MTPLPSEHQASSGLGPQANDPVRTPPSREQTARRALIWLWCVALFITLLIQVPGLGNSDTAIRLQTTRSWWSDEPPVRTATNAPFGITGLNGVIHAWYGAGQSALMLPADLVAGLVDHRIHDPESKLRVRSGIVATLTFPPLVATTVVLVFLWLGQLGFTPIECWVGALGMMLGTSYFSYTQNHMENSLQVFLLATDAVLIGRWMRTGSRGCLLLAGLSIGAALTVSLPALGEHFGIWMSAILCCGFQARRQAQDVNEKLTWARINHSYRPLQVLALVSPGLLLGILVDRFYHWIRFGHWTGTYVSLMAKKMLLRDPRLSPNFPFDGNFWDGFWGPLVAPGRGLLFFDPLAIVLLGLVLWQWKKISTPVRCALIGLGIGHLILLIFYARVSFWDGGGVWGNRYTLTPVHLALAMTLPLWLRLLGWKSALTLNLLPTTIFVAGTIQILSILLPASVEVGQIDNQSQATPVPIQRAINVVNLLRGMPPLAGLTSKEWRINLAPATLSMGNPRLARVLWLGWGLAVGGALILLLRSWRAVLAWDDLQAEESDAEA